MRLALLALALVLPVSAQTVTRVSASSSGQEGNGPTTSVTISESGRWVAMQSSASNLVAGDTNGADDVFLHDRNWGTTTRISVATGGAEANGASGTPSISGSGERIAFESTATNLVPGYGPAQQIYVHDRVAGTTVAASATAGNDASSECAISLDGQWVAFHSDATNLVGGDTNGTTDVFLAEVATGTTTRVSVSTGGTEGNGASTRPSVSADGRWVTFVSSASNLVPGDTNGADDVFLHDTLTGQTTRVSTTSAAAQANGQTVAGTISPDGGYVALASDASNLVFGDTNGARDIFVKVLGSGLVVRVSVSSSGTQASSNSFFPGVSWYGSEVSFHTLASLVPGDTNGQRDVYTHSLDSGLTTLVSATPSGTTASGTSWLADLDTGGRVTVFQSDAPDLVAGDTNGVSDAFVQLQKATWYIDVAGAGSGTGTPGNPYTSIQYAIDRPQTVGGDELLVAAGTYYENVDLRGKSVELMSLAGSSATVVDGLALRSVFTATQGEGPGTTIQGMTIRNGAGVPVTPGYNGGGGILMMMSDLLVKDCDIIDNGTNSPTEWGGGVYAEGGTLTVDSCTVSGNCGYDKGAGLFLRDAVVHIEETEIRDHAPTSTFTLGLGIYFDGVESSLTMVRSSFIRNGYQAYSGVGPGGGLFAQGASLQLSEVAFIENYASVGGGAYIASADAVLNDCVFTGNFGDGGGAVIGGSVAMTNCTFQYNIGGFSHGGALAGGGDIVMIGCSIIGNSAGYDDHDGGGVWFGGGTLSVSDCLFLGNVGFKGGGMFLGFGIQGDVDDTQFIGNFSACGMISGAGGGAFLDPSAAVSFDRCVFAGNHASPCPYSPGGGTALYGPASVSNSTFYRSDPEQWLSGVDGANLTNCIVGGVGTPELINSTSTYSNIQGGYPGTGNIDEDPLFWDAEGGDFHLMPGSPCIDAGDPTSPPDPDGSIADMGAFPFDPDYCPPATNYCTAGTTGNGCMATISATGTPSLSASSGFQISVTNVEGQKQGIIFWGLTGKAAPWGGGSSWLCVQAPAKRTGTQDSGGTAGQCDGSFSLDFNAWMAANPGKAPGLGEVIYMQAWFRDPPSPKTTSLSDGLRFVVCQ